MSDGGSPGSVTDSFTETTTASRLSRIGNAIVGVLIGPVLIAGSSVFLVWNEGQAVKTHRSLAGGALLVDGRGLAYGVRQMATRRAAARIGKTAKAS